MGAKISSYLPFTLQSPPPPPLQITYITPEDLDRQVCIATIWAPVNLHSLRLLEMEFSYLCYEASTLVDLNRVLTYLRSHLAEYAHLSGVQIRQGAFILGRIYAHGPGPIISIEIA